MNTKLLPADPDGLNDDRAEWAGEAVEAFAGAVYATRTTESDATILSDLLCNLRHWADRNAVDFDTALVQAICHYADETMQPRIPAMPSAIAAPYGCMDPHPVAGVVAGHINRCAKGG